MLIVKEIYSPVILTIPDDAAVFSALKPMQKMTEKIIMENYINFLCYKSSVSGISFFRFEDSINYESIDGFTRCFIPIDMMKKYQSQLDILYQLIIEGYFITMPVDKGSIDFYGRNVEGTHLAFLYGMDTTREIFLCKDFSGLHFVDFEVTFDAMRKSLKRYNRSDQQETDGLRAFRLNEKAKVWIDYAKTYSEFYKLGQEFASSEKGYGLGAIDLYLNEIKRYPYNIELIQSWYVIGNYLREAAKLMRFRYDVLRKDKYCAGTNKMLDGEAIIMSLVKNTDILFFHICKLQKNRVIVNETISDELTSLVRRCRSDLKSVSAYFCKTIFESKLDR